MTSLLFAAQWIHLTLCAVLAGIFCILLLAGQPRTAIMRHWEKHVLRWAPLLALGALSSGVVVMMIQTAQLEGRPTAALELRAILRALLDTQAGFVWMTRQGLLLVLAAFVVLTNEVHTERNWIAARGQAFILAAGALALIGSSSHLAAMSESPWTQGHAMSHLPGAGAWVGGFPALALLLYGASRVAGPPDPYVARTIQRFSRLTLIVVLLLVGSGVASARLLDPDPRPSLRDGTRSSPSRQACCSCSRACPGRRKRRDGATAFEPDNDGVVCGRPAHGAVRYDRVKSRAPLARPRYGNDNGDARASQ
jgi:putative copper export protein